MPHAKAKHFEKELKKELSNFSGIDYEKIKHRGYPALKLNVRGTECVFFIPTIGKDTHSIKNCRSQLKRKLIEMGARR